jgi:hypothetical protein
MREPYFDFSLDLKAVLLESACKVGLIDAFVSEAAQSILGIERMTHDLEVDSLKIGL